MHQYICKSVILINIANYCSIAILLLGVLNIQVIFMPVLSKTGGSDVDATLKLAHTAHPSPYIPQVLGHSLMVSGR